MSFNKTISNLAYERYQEATGKIEQIKVGIAENRSGTATLTDIQTDSDKLAKRVVRENVPYSAALERINGVPNFQDIQILNKIFRIAESVGRVIIKTRYGSSGFGTGFMIAPGIFITNNHVFPDADTARNSSVQFYYELDGDSTSKRLQTFGFNPDQFFITSSYEKNNAPNSGMDFTILALKEKSKEGKKIEEIPYATLDENLGKIIEGENCVVIQHPKGDYKKIVMKDIRMLTLKDDFLLYESDTLPGSSGAMVIGLGTGEVVALHHSSIPRKNAQGQILRKSGGVYNSGEPDEAIDWIGNEGIRVSSLLRTIRNIDVSPAMLQYKELILRNAQPVRNIKEIAQENPPINSPNLPQQEHNEPLKTQEPMKNSQNKVVNQAINILQNSNSEEEGILQYFEVELANIQIMQDDWKMHFEKLVPGIVSSEPLFPFSTVPSQKAMQYITIRTTENPWEVSAKLEALPQVKTASPDLPMDTDMQYGSRSNFRVTESDFMENMKTSRAAGIADDFKMKWNSSPYFDLKEDQTEQRQRSWNRIAIGLTETFPEKPNFKKLVGTDIQSLIYKSIPNPNEAKKVFEKLKLLNLIQLDTGYTDHAKVRGKFNYDRDEDFIDGSDARDEMIAGLLKHPGHGTRTASIIFGGKMNYIKDGNNGVLCDKQEESLIKIIPYRIAESVILIGRGKNLVDAVNQAINSNADVVFMCMGSYPRPMIAEAAKAAYENGIIWCCAAGNEVEIIVAPALYPGTIAVAAINPNQKPWRGSSYGKGVDIAAPGEDVYVPSMDDKQNEIMVYGSGTSYATPHVAAAATIWKAKNYEEILKLYKFQWQIVEAFRYCLKKSAYATIDWDSKNYGAGVLNMYNLLRTPLPKAEDLKNAYRDKQQTEWDLGIREGIHFLWKTLVRKVTPGIQAESIVDEMMLTERGRIAISAISGNTASSVFESDSLNSVNDSEKILKMYFNSYEV